MGLFDGATHTAYNWITNYALNIKNSILDPTNNAAAVKEFWDNHTKVIAQSNDLNYDKYLNSMLSKVNMEALSSIDGLPYQFLPNVDRRLDRANEDGSRSKNNINNVGRKYTEKIVSRMPLLFLMPCTAKFMADSDDNAAAALLTGTLAKIQELDTAAVLNTISELLGSDIASEKSARYYGTEFAYDGYYNYLQVMINTLASYLGIEDKEVYFRGKKQKIASIDWSTENEGIDDFAMYLSGMESIVFYMDGIDSVSETFSNDTTMPSIASEFNSKGEEARQMRFLFGNKADKAAFVTGVKAVGGRISESVKAFLNGDLSGIGETLEFASDYLNSAMFRDLISESPSTILQGGRLIFPEIWNDSSYSKSYNISIKLRSPDHDTVSIFMNILVPYCKLLALTLPHTESSVNTTGEEEDTEAYMNPNTYFAPYLVKAFSPGSINITMGIIDSLSVNKGATCQWNIDGLPTQIDIDLSIKDLYHSLAMSGWGQNVLFDTNLNLGKIWSAVSNTAYMDFLANMAGLNVKDTHNRKVEMALDLMTARFRNTGARIETHFANKISDYVKAFYDW